VLSPRSRPCAVIDGQRQDFCEAVHELRAATPNGGRSCTPAGDNHRRISRRVFLAGTALGAASAATVTSQTVAQVKISQRTANYQNTPKGDQRCGGCANFQPPNACKFVEGHISSTGGCQLFVKKT
jgi:hypothetical protein